MKQDTPKGLNSITSDFSRTTPKKWSGSGFNLTTL